MLCCSGERYRAIMALLLKKLSWIKVVWHLVLQTESGLMFHQMKCPVRRKYQGGKKQNKNKIKKKTNRSISYSDFHFFFQVENSG